MNSGHIGMIQELTRMLQVHPMMLQPRFWPLAILPCLVLSHTEALQVYDCEGKDTMFETNDLTATANYPKIEGAYQKATMKSIQILHNNQTKHI